MKIEKLYALSQFIEHVDAEIGDLKQDAIKCWNLTWGYNQFLLSPITKDMFINPCTHPDNMPVKWSCKKGNPFYEDHLSRWREAEKKVIFEGGIDKMYYFCPDNYAARRDLRYWLMNEFKLYDLAEATKGELVLKNIEL